MTVESSLTKFVDKHILYSKLFKKIIFLKLDLSNEEIVHRDLIDSI